MDDASTESLKAAVLESARYYERLSPDTRFSVGADTYSARELADSMNYLSGLIGEPDWTARLRDDFAVYQSTGKDEARTVVYSAYYEPTLSARLAPDAVYRYPIYGRPEDLVDADLGLFEPSLQGMRIAGRVQGRQLVPYYTRQDIDALGALKDTGRAIAWAKDPMDIFFLQVEGSGWLDLGGGSRRRIRFDGHNGRKYVSVGLYLIESGRIPRERFNRDAMVRYMRENPAARQQILNVNPRYVFFRLDDSSAAVHAFGNIGAALTPGRSIATDPRLFPKGALAWIDVGSEGRGGGGTASPPILRPSVPPIRRFVLNQDEGGAIKGPARVDFFVGGGDAQEKMAFSLWHPGRLYFLVKKKG